MTKYLFSLIFAATMISAAIVQKKQTAIEKAIIYAQNVAFVHTKINTEGFLVRTTLGSIEHPAYVFYAGDETGLDAAIEIKEPFRKEYWGRFRVSNRMHSANLFGGKAYITYSGSYILLVPRNGSIAEKTDYGIKFEVDTLVFNFEEGKFYTIDGRVDEENKIDFSIKETDITPYLAYQTANPNRLDGTWSGEGKRLLTTFLNQYYFDGSRLKFAGESKKPKQTFVVEGKIMYNENTIIFFPESARHKGKEVKNFNSRADRAVYIWHYTFTNNELHIEEGSPFLIGTQSWVNTGIFQKIN